MRELSRSEPKLDIEKARQERVQRSRQLMQEWEGKHWKIVKWGQTLPERGWWRIFLKDGSIFEYDPHFIFVDTVPTSPEVVSGSNFENILQSLAPDRIFIGWDRENEAILAQPQLTELELPLIEDARIDKNISADGKRYVFIDDYDVNIHPTRYEAVAFQLSHFSDFSRLASVYMERRRGEDFDLSAFLKFLYALLSQLQLWGYDTLVIGALDDRLSKLYQKMGLKKVDSPLKEDCLVGDIDQLLKNLEELTGKR